MISYKVKGILAMGLAMMSEMQQQRDDWNDRIITEWHKSANYPRKKKKRVRRGLMLEWSLSNYNPFYQN